MTGVNQADAGIHLKLCSSVNLPSEFCIPGADCLRLLPPLRPAAEFPTRLHWAVSRLKHYTVRDMRFVRWVQEQRPDIVHVQEWFPLLSRRFVRKIQNCGTKVVVSVHNLVRHEEHFPGHARVQAAFERRAWREAERLVVMGPGLAKTLTETFGISESSVRLVPHMVWPTSVNLDSNRLVQKRQKKTALMFGMIRRNKGAETLVAACSARDELLGLIAGHAEDPGYVSALREQARMQMASVEIRNHFYGENEIGDLFSESSLAVFPYTSFASQSGALFMAVAHETPSIGTDVGALGETIRQNGIGLLVPPNDSAALSKAIDSLHEPARYEAAVAQCKRMKRDFSLQRIGALMTDVYRGLKTNLAGHSQEHGVSPCCS